MISKRQLVEEIKRQEIFTPLVEKALKQAEISHTGQKRYSGGSALRNHIYPVAHSILRRFENSTMTEDLVILALLHDTMEDDESFTLDACREDFNKSVCKNVEKLTKDECILRSYSGNDKILYELLKYFCNKEYIKGVKKASEVCKIVKLEDRINNLQSIKKIGSSVKNLRYVIEADTLFMVMARETRSFDYVPLLKEEIQRLCPTLP